MPPLEVAAGVDHCPVCGGRLSAPTARRGVRTCLNLNRGTCDVQTVPAEAETPASVPPPRPRTLVLPAALPFERSE